MLSLRAFPKKTFYKYAKDEGLEKAAHGKEDIVYRRFAAVLLFGRQLVKYGGLLLLLGLSLLLQLGKMPLNLGNEFLCGGLYRFKGRF